MIMPLPAAPDHGDAEETGVEGRMSSTLARAEAAVASLSENFASLALADAAKARAALTAAINDAAGRGRHVEAVFRVAHDLKGQGASFGFPLITRIGHSLSALTRDRARCYESKHLDLAKAHLDAIDLILAKGIKGDGGKVGAELAGRLEQRVKDIAG
jgi:chemotaxis protein histidine kinase CheA